jgi:hypothetical protein
MDGTPQYLAFVERYGKPNFFASKVTPSFIDRDVVVLGCRSYTKCSKAVLVAAGDSITAAVVQHSLYTRWTITDRRNGTIVWSHNKTWLTHAHLHSAECIVEAPGSRLPDFGKTIFSDCHASDQNGIMHTLANGSVPSGWTQSEWAIVRKGVTLATPSANPLTVTYSQAPRAGIQSSACIDQGTATRLFLASGAVGITGTEQVQQISCAGDWAEGTIISGPNGAGTVAFHMVDGTWAYATSSAFYSEFCGQMSQLGAPASMLSDCPAGSTTATPAPTTLAPAPVTPPTSSSAPCTDTALAQAANAWNVQQGNPEGSGSTMQFFACVGNYAGVVFSPGSDQILGQLWPFRPRLARGQFWGSGISCPQMSEYLGTSISSYPPSCPAIPLAIHLQRSDESVVESRSAKAASDSLSKHFVEPVERTGNGRI